MSMIRHPVVYTAIPSGILVPAAGSGVWYPLHDSSLLAGIGDLPTLVRTVTGSPSANEWTTPGVITFPADHTTTNTVALVAIDDDDDRYIDSQMSYVGAAVGNQWIYTLKASYTQLTGGNSFFFGYGKDSGTATLTGLYLANTDTPGFYHRAKGQSTTEVTTALSISSGTFASLKGAGLFDLVFSVHVTQVSPDLTVNGATALVDLAVHASNGTQSCVYTATGIDILQWANGGRELPGISGSVVASTVGGLAIGGRLTSADVFGSGWGRGSAGGGNIGKIGCFAQRKFTTYDASRAADTLTSLLARPLEFPRTLCRDFI